MDTEPTAKLSGAAPIEVAVGSCAARGAVSGGAASRGAESKGAGSGGAEPRGEEPGGAEPAGVEPGGVEPEGVELGGAESEGAEFGGAEPQGTASSGDAIGASPRLSPQQLREWLVWRARLRSGATGARGAGAAGAEGARTRGTGGARTSGVGGAGARDPTEPGAARAGGSGTGGAEAGGAGAGGTGAGGARAGGAGAVNPGGTVRPQPYFVPLLQHVLGVPASRPVSPIRTARCVPRSRPPLVPSTHAMALRPSSVPLCVPLPAPPESSLPTVPDPESDRARAASPTVSGLLATAVTDPSFESAAASALVAELLDFAAACRLNYATALVAQSASASPPSVSGEYALGMDVLEDRQEEFECLAAAVPHFASMLLDPEGDPDAPDIPTPCSYAEAITGFTQRHGVDYFQTFSPTPKMITLRVLLHVAAQRDYELQTLDFSTAFLQGNLHKEIWLRRPPGFIGSFPVGTPWSLRRPVYGLRQAPRKWHDTLRTTLADLGFAPSTADPSLFLRTDTSLPPFYVLIYVDDLVFATADTEALTLVKSELQKRHTCIDLGELRSYLGLQITRDRARCTITLTQSHMVHQVLQRFDFQFFSPQPTPLSTSHSLSAPPSDESVEPSGLYPELVGCLMSYAGSPTCRLIWESSLVRLQFSPRAAPGGPLAAPAALLAAPYGPLTAPCCCLPCALRCLASPRSACCAIMASLRMLAFDHEGRPLQFDTWLDDLQLYLLSDSRDSVSLFDLDYDAILSAMYSLSASAEGDCYWCVLPDPGIEAAALGASESSIPGTAPAEALHTSTLDSGASHCFFRDSTTLTPLPAPVSVRLADPSGGPVVACSPTFLPSGSTPLLVLPPLAPDSSVAPPPWSPLPATPAWHALPPPCLWSFQVSTSPPALTGSALPSLCRGAAPRRSALLLVSPDDCSPADSPHGLRLQLRERFHEDLLVLRLHFARGGEFSSDLFWDIFHGEGILQLLTLPASPQQNGIAERHIAPHFLWPFAFRYAAHQLSLWPRVSLPETSSTLRWTGEVGDASVFRVSGSRAFVRDTSADKLSARAIPCVFLGFRPNAPGWQFYHPTSRRVFPSQDVTFDESVPFYRLFPYRSAPPQPPPLFLAPGPPPVDHLLPQGTAPSGLSQVDPLPGTVPVEVAGDPGAARGAVSVGAAFGGAKPGGAEPGGAESEGAGSEGAEPVGAEHGGAEPRGTASSGGPAGASPQLSPRPEPLSRQQLREWFTQRTRLRSGAAGAGDSAAGDNGAGGAGFIAGACGTGGAAAPSPKSARTKGTGAAGSGTVGGTGAGDPTEPGAAGAGGPGTGGTRAGGAGAVGARARGTGAGDSGAGGAGAGGAVSSGTDAGGTVRPRPYFVPLLQQVLVVPSSTGLTPPLLCPPPNQSQPSLQPASPLSAPSPYTEETGGLTERREPASCPASPVRTCCRVPRPRPPPVPGTHAIALRPSSVPLRVPLPPPLESSLPAVPDPESDRARAASPTVSRLLARVVTDPSFESTAASADVTELVDFAVACRLDYASALVAESESAGPPSLEGECALGTYILEVRQEDFECLAAAVHHFASMLLAPEGDPDAPDISTPRSYAEAIMGPYSSQWQAAMDAKMASWKSTGFYVDALPPSRANIVNGMWIFRVKRPPGSLPTFKARYVARGFTQRQGVDYFQTFSPTLKMTTLRLLLHVAAQHDYELHSLDFDTTFLQGSLHEEI
ncbi:unnamed protein product [Closterium sp. NIES-54]